VLAGDYQGDGLLPWLGDRLSEVFYGGQTDLVVNTPSMSGGAARVPAILQKALSGPQVTHFSYFARDESALRAAGGAAGRRSLLRTAGRPVPRRDRPRRHKAQAQGQDAPIVFLLPGIMGSHIQVGRNRIWFDPFSMWTGGMAKVKVGARGVSADGWMDRNYESTGALPGR
jgi:hypothetical protein